MKSPFLNFIVLVASLAAAATGSVLASGQANLVTVVLLLLGGYGLGATFPSFWARLRGVKTNTPQRAMSKQEDRSSRRKGGRRGAERSPRPDRQRNDGKRTERRDRGEKRQRPKSRKNAVRTVGTVKWFDVSKGYGFITPEKGGEDCFVHKSVVSNGGDLVEGGKVEFEITKDDRGRVAAANVVPIP